MYTHSCACHSIIDTYSCACHSKMYSQSCVYEHTLMRFERRIPMLHSIKPLQRYYIVFILPNIFHKKVLFIAFFLANTNFSCHFFQKHPSTTITFLPTHPAKTIPLLSTNPAFNTGSPLLAFPLNPPYKTIHYKQHCTGDNAA